MTVLILSKDADTHVQHVTAELDRLGCHWMRFDPIEVLSAVRLSRQIGGTTATLLYSQLVRRLR